MSVQSQAAGIALAAGAATCPLAPIEFHAARHRRPLVLEYSSWLLPMQVPLRSAAGKARLEGAQSPEMLVEAMEQALDS